MKINKYVYLLYNCLFLILMAGFSACKHDDYTVKKSNENIRLAGDFLKNNYDYTLFYAALDYTGILPQLNEKGPFTVLAPNNKAFIELGIQSAADIKKLNRDSLKQAMALHIISRSLRQSDVPVNTVNVEYQSLAGVPVYVSFGTKNPANPDEYEWTSVLYFNGSRATRKDVQLVNGILHSLDKVMKRYPGKGVQQWLSDRPAYSIFVSGLKKFGLWDELAGKGPFTIFAPNNQAFTNMGISKADIDALDPGKYIGPRLFGAYIQYEKRYFLSDLNAFSFINNQNTYENFTRNGNSYFKWYAYGATHTISLADRKEFPSVGYGQSIIELATMGYRMDNLCDNGTVQDLPELLVTPGQALKK
ncbi:fasciclin domain-containing protein [Pedobacter nutrimenti]|uniref:Fasciclin domain-containing protein n=1 Tax=Pedobacter nutrimenti TaxID=1241337 RepID=A0A318UNS2_9SPHI|nr:fasciclin domain-containing protein [Pedobacter nutrimenti]PYF71651.1 fasciclin domain-containing protein [Pedobacter nutrimenti]|eukprot:gene19223-23031_t